MTSTHTAADLALLLGTVPLGECDERTLLDALAAAVDSARYWQECDGEDALAASPEVCDALARVAGVVTSSTLTSWWTTSLGPTSQWSVTFHDPASPATAPVAGTVAEHLLRWRSQTVLEETSAQQDRPSDPRAAWSGQWGSTPPTGLTRTTRSLGVLGPVGLWLVEDGHGWDRATARPVVVRGDANLYEVDGADAWARLCRRYPLEVTASRRHDWYRATGVAARWVIPDWSRVGDDLGGVHLTVAGYLATAGRAIAVTDDTSTVLAGWDPDATYWLTDLAPAAATEQTWVRDHDGTWTQDLH